MKRVIPKKGVVIYQAKNGAIELRGDTSRETLWATQAQIAEIFGVNVRTISEHFVNIFESMERNLRKKCNSSNYKLVCGTIAL